MLSGSCSAPKLWPSSCVVTKSASWTQALVILSDTELQKFDLWGEEEGKTYLGKDGFAIVLGAGQSGVQKNGLLHRVGRKVRCEIKQNGKVGGQQISVVQNSNRVICVFCPYVLGRDHPVLEVWRGPRRLAPVCPDRSPGRWTGGPDTPRRHCPLCLS